MDPAKYTRNSEDHCFTPVLPLYRVVFCAAGRENTITTLFSLSTPMFLMKTQLFKCKNYMSSWKFVWYIKWNVFSFTYSYMVWGCMFTEDNSVHKFEKKKISCIQLFPGWCLKWRNTLFYWIITRLISSHYLYHSHIFYYSLLIIYQLGLILLLYLQYTWLSFCAFIIKSFIYSSIIVHLKRSVGTRWPYKISTLIEMWNHYQYQVAQVFNKLI